MTSPSIPLARRAAALACAAAAAACQSGSVSEPGPSGPPVATIQLPAEQTVEVAPGTSVRFTGKCTVANATHAWDLGGGSPAASTVAAPGLVRFDVEGTYTISYTCTAGDVTSPAVERTVVVRQPRTSAYQLEVRYLTTVTPAQQDAFEAAAARVREVIVGAAPTVHVSGDPCGAGTTLDEDVPGLLILASVAPIDGAGGILGQAGPCAVRQSDGLPVLGDMEFDSADLAMLETTGRLRSVVLHEMLHVVGFGTIWEDDGLLKGKGGSDPRYLGGGAEGAYLDWNGGHAATVPVENTGGVGTRDAHWREAVFTSELMTGWISGTAQPFSRTTVGSLADLGYDVEPLAADDFTVTATGSLVGTPGPDDLELVGDVRSGPPIVVE